MKAVMKRAWEIRKAAAKVQGVKVTEISMSECMKEAWAATKNVITHEILWGRDIREVAETTIYIAKKENKNVIFTFNGTKVTVDRKDGINDVVRKYDSSLFSLESYAQNA